MLEIVLMAGGTTQSVKSAAEISKILFFHIAKEKVLTEMSPRAWFSILIKSFIIPFSFSCGLGALICDPHYLS